MSFLYSAALVTLADLDKEVLVKFYTKFLDLEPNPYIPNTYAEFQLSGLRLGIFKPKDSHKSEFVNRAKTGMSLAQEWVAAPVPCNSNSSGPSPMVCTCHVMP